jgi:glucokinase
MAGSKFIAVDLGGTNLRVSLVKNNKIIKYIKKSTPGNLKNLVSCLFQTIDDLMSRYVEGIGVSSAGPLKEGVIKNPPNLPLKNYDLKSELKKRFRVRVEVGNDAGCAAIAEAKLGVKKKNFIVLTMGTGLGGGIIINGELFEGEGYGGELGHIILDNGKDFESLVAWKRTRKITKKYFKKELMISELIEIKDRRAVKILEETAMYLGQGIGSLINVFDPEVVVLTGGVRESGSFFLNMIKKYTQKYSMLPKKTPIVWSKLDHPGTLGAYLLIKNKK